jgi:pullulanase
MNNLYANIVGFKKISLNSNDPENFNIRKLNIKNGTKTLPIENYTLNSQDSFIIFLEEEIDIKYYCYLNYEGIQIKAFYKDLFSTADFNEKFYYDGDLGLNYTKEASIFKVWSPPAISVALLIYKNGDICIQEAPREIQMLQTENGVWEVIINEDLNNLFYTYKISIYESTNEAVDPYAKAVGINGLRGAIIALTSTNPKDWDGDKAPYLQHYTDAIIYETSIRDISMHESSNVLHKGKYLGLTEDNTVSKKGIPTALSHIKELGITHLQLMPFYDFSYTSTDEKNPEKYNWGYDPQNNNVPEGSFSLNPYDPRCRILELKMMIQHLHLNNICVNMDVVYNHLNHKTDNNFEKIFPEYYFRFNEDGSFSNGSSCGNDTASEHSMMRKFIIDSVNYWAKEYHIDGFRFDLMGLHDIKTMNAIYESLSKLDRKIMLYGEGWDLKTTLSESLKTIQENSYKVPSIGFFNDTIRDSIKGSVFSLKDRGFISGKENVEDIIKGCTLGSSISRDMFKAIYVSPEQSINYVSCHDNNTLWDKLELSNKEDSLEDRKSMHKLANAIILTSQGVPFLYSGVEFCRTKDGIEDSVRASDSINSLNYDRKIEFLDIFNYYKGLIELRKEHPAFRMFDVEEIKSHIEFIENTPKNTVAFTIKNHANGDSWNNILVIYNGNKFPVTINVPWNVWNQVLDKNRAGNTTLKIINSDKICIEGICMNVLYSD